MLMHDVLDWEEAVQNAEHYLAVGQKEIYLGHDAASYPWEFVTSCEPGGSHRMEIATDVVFYAKAAGLTFRWFFDIEPRSANGKGSYEIDMASIQRVLAKLPAAAKGTFRGYLKDCAIAVRQKADEWNEVAVRQYGTAAQLEKAAETGEK